MHHQHHSPDVRSGSHNNVDILAPISLKDTHNIRVRDSQETINDTEGGVSPIIPRKSNVKMVNRGNVMESTTNRQQITITIVEDADQT